LLSSILRFFLPFSVAAEAADEEGIAAPTQAEASRLEFHSLDFSSMINHLCKYVYIYIFRETER
jgi:hypothetical protein